MSWLAGYVYRKKGAVDATIAGEQAEYQLELIVGESSCAAGEDVDCENHCKDFPNDLRFTKEDGVTKHKYWVDLSSLEGNAPNRKVRIWIKVALIPASGLVDFYMYYGKLVDAGESNGDDTFTFFDDFSDYNLKNLESAQWAEYSGNPVAGADERLMYYFYDTSWPHAFKALAQGYSGSDAHTYLYHSDDGLSWTSDGKVFDNGDAYSFVKSGLKDPVTGRGIKDGDGKYKMVYVGPDGAHETVGLAESADLINWTDLGFILTPDSACVPDDVVTLFPNDLIKLGSWYYLIVDESTTGAEIYRIALYKTLDLTGTWIRVGVLLDYITSDVWDKEACHANLVYSDNNWILYYTGIDKSDIYKIGSATSDTIDGPYIRYAGNPIVTKATRASHPRLVYNDEKTAWWFYCEDWIGADYYVDVHFSGVYDLTEKWNIISGTPVVQDSKLELSNFEEQVMTKKADFNRSLAFESKYSMDSEAEFERGVIGFLTTSNWRREAGSGYVKNIYSNFSPQTVKILRLDSGVYTELDAGADKDSTIWKIYSLKILTSDLAGYIDGEADTSAIDSVYSCGYFSLVSRGATTKYWDWVLVRRCVDPEPTWGSWGSEEVQVRGGLRLKLLQME